jgi:hypothetical protein
LSGGLIALISVLAGERKEGEKVGARWIPRGCGGGRRAGGRRKERGRREADRWGPGVSDRKNKKKRERERWAGAGRLDGPTGRLGRKVSREWFSFFFFFFFKLLFQTTFLFKFKSNSFKLFLKNFINFLETTQATKNHASQLMMHIHLLSLSLLNYV